MRAILYWLCKTAFPMELKCAPLTNGDFLDRDISITAKYWAYQAVVVVPDFRR